MKQSASDHVQQWPGYNGYWHFQGWENWTQFVSDRPQMEQTWDILRSICTANLILKNPETSYLGQSDQIWGQIWHPCAKASSYGVQGCHIFDAKYDIPEVACVIDVAFPF